MRATPLVGMTMEMIRSMRSLRSLRLSIRRCIDDEKTAHRSFSIGCFVFKLSRPYPSGYSALWIILRRSFHRQILLALYICKRHLPSSSCSS